MYDFKATAFLNITEELTVMVPHLSTIRTRTHELVVRESSINSGHWIRGQMFTHHSQTFLVSRNVTILKLNFKHDFYIVLFYYEVVLINFSYKNNNISIVF